jgi:MSHA pilin protein MshC
MKRADGFTMIELVLVIIILGVLSAYAIPRINFKMFDAHVAAQELVEAIRYAQEMSMTHSGSAPFQVELDGSANSYEVTQNGTAISNPYTGGANFVSDWSDVAINQSGIIEFNSRGIPSCSSGLAACSEPSGNNVTIVVSVGSDIKTVVVERMTGYARLN